jgi:GalNAc5-diNAcBac-PP-undecaprenol beta-1,3-glucosyltransferase
VITFSVIIPTYNRAGFIAETLDTILQQTYPHFEVIIVDDGSTDRTRQIIENGYGNDTRVKYYYKQNEERGAARNFGIQHAKCDYAFFFDSDDWMHKDHLEVIASELNKPNQSINFIAAKYLYKVGDNKVRLAGSFNLKPGWHGMDSLIKGNDFGCLYAVNLKNPELILFPKEREYSTIEDWMFLLLNLQKDRIYLIDKLTITYRHHDDRSMINNQRVINTRKKATEWALNNINLTPAQKQKLRAWSHYFYGIHEHLDNNRRKALKEILMAFRLGGFDKKFFILFIKSIIGRKLISKLK